MQKIFILPFIAFSRAIRLISRLLFFLILLAFLGIIFALVHYLFWPLDTSIGASTTRWELIQAEKSAIDNMNLNCRRELYVHVGLGVITTSELLFINAPIRWLAGYDVVQELMSGSNGPIHDAFEMENPERDAYSFKDIWILWTQFPGQYFDSLMWGFAHTGTKPFQGILSDCRFPIDFVKLETILPINPQDIQFFILDPSSYQDDSRTNSANIPDER